MNPILFKIHFLSIIQDLANSNKENSQTDNDNGYCKNI